MKASYVSQEGNVMQSKDHRVYSSFIAQTVIECLSCTGSVLGLGRVANQRPPSQSIMC